MRMINVTVIILLSRLLKHLLLDWFTDRLINWLIHCSSWLIIRFWSSFEGLCWTNYCIITCCIGGPNFINFWTGVVKIHAMKQGGSSFLIHPIPLRVLFYKTTCAVNYVALHIAVGVSKSWNIPGPALEQSSVKLVGWFALTGPSNAGPVTLTLTLSESVSLSVTFTFQGHYKQSETRNFQ